MIAPTRWRVGSILGLDAPSTNLYQVRSTIFTDCDPSGEELVQPDQERRPCHREAATSIDHLARARTRFHLGGPLACQTAAPCRWNVATQHKAARRTP